MKIFKDCSPMTQAIIIKDYIKFMLECREVSLSLIDAYNELMQNEVVTYDKDGIIE